MLINPLVNYHYYYYYSIIIYAIKQFNYLIIKQLINYWNKLTSNTEFKQIIELFNNIQFHLSWTKRNISMNRLNSSLKYIRVNFENLSLKSTESAYIKCDQMISYNNNNNNNIEKVEIMKILKNPLTHNITDYYIEATKKKHYLLLNKIIQILIIIILFNYSIVYVNNNLCIDAMHLHNTILSPLTETSTDSETILESDSSTLPTYLIDSPVVKLIKTPKTTQRSYLDNGLQLENKVMQRISSIFQDKKAIQDLLTEMNAYYLTYGRPRYG
ncbi:hypothetical protein MS3_00003836 [Schistosoma haematobium]|uniref:Uncharacterized protein n=1 Tax=Schistosoma haematobium TaxID=6185 RepID=A0A922LQZ4_SCHHA|nr:hypothetical protein MS3_00003836 [Schistosoma haematobium]KAH9591617.1 hypothetical protein MS3_00003836 [Schistosoma haematobium]